jgi:hypothetical protein
LNPVRAQQRDGHARSQTQNDLDQCSAHHQDSHAIPLSPQRHPQSDLAFACATLVRRNPVEPDRCEHQCEQSEQRRQTSFAVALGPAPGALDPSILFQANESGIERSLVQIEELVRNLLQPGRNLMGMLRSHARQSP